MVHEEGGERSDGEGEGEGVLTTVEAIMPGLDFANHGGAQLPLGVGQRGSGEVISSKPV